MSAVAGRSLPAALAADLAEPARARDQALLLSTLDHAGAPRIALLSRAEVCVADPARLVLALWSGSRSADNLGRSGRATLFWVAGGAAVSVALAAGGDAAELGSARNGERALLAFPLRVEEVRTDEVPYAELVSPLTFELQEPDDVLPRWADVAQRLAEFARRPPGVTKLRGSS